MYLIFAKIKNILPESSQVDWEKWSLTWIWWEKCSALRFFGTWYCKLFQFCVFLSLQAHSTPPPPPKPQNSWPRHHVGCCSNRFRCSKCTNCQLKVAHSKAKHLQIWQNKLHYSTEKLKLKIVFPFKKLKYILQWKMEHNLVFRFKLVVPKTCRHDLWAHVSKHCENSSNSQHLWKFIGRSFLNSCSKPQTWMTPTVETVTKFMFVFLICCPARHDSSKAVTTFIII